MIDTPCKRITVDTQASPDTTPQYRKPAGRREPSYEHCAVVDWPAPYLWTARQYRRGYYGVPSWMGSLIYEGRDLSGLYYRRNRFYDPETGRFTQEDPIGLAGGLNAYGFAEGDPVGYSDPYGLCPESLRDRKNRCPGKLSIDQYNSIETSARDGLTGGARDRILHMLENGDIRLVRGTANGQPAGADFRNGQIRVTDLFFTSARPNGRNGTGYGSADERAWVLAHELGHLHQAEAGMLISEMGTGIQPNFTRIQRLLYSAGREDADAQVDANAYACLVTRNPGAWQNTPGCRP